MKKYLSNDLNKETDHAVYFYTPEFYVFDNFSAFAIKIWERIFPTSEHAYQWKKYSDSQPDIAELIFNASSPNATKKIADANKDKVAPGWHEHKTGIMEEILRAKLHQHEKVREALLRTGDREIVENSPADDFWGAGPNGTGRNELGKLWMKLRTESI